VKGDGERLWSRTYRVLGLVKLVTGRIFGS
jgi:hypothetical protein